MSALRIARITVWAKALQLREPYWLSGGRLKFEALDSTFVRIECDDGNVGWGEGCPWGNTYLPAFGGGIRAATELLAPRLIGENPLDVDRLNRLIDTTLPGHLYAKSALDVALWDIAARRADVPLYTLLGGADGNSVDVNSSIPTGTPEQMVASLLAARNEGYRTHSAKIGGDQAAFDVARIEAIEAVCLPDEKVTYDVNRSWTPSIAIEVMNSVPGNGWYEQPCETLDQCVRVQRKTRQPIALDECLHTYQDHLDAWKLEACQGVKVKPNRLGGITKSRRVRDLGVAVGWRMHIEDVGGTVLADTAAIHLALSTPQENRMASWLCHPHLADDYAAGEGARNEHGKIVLADKPGIGVEPPEEWLGEPYRTLSKAPCDESRSTDTDYAQRESLPAGPMLEKVPRAVQSHRYVSEIGGEAPWHSMISN